MSSFTSHKIPFTKSDISIIILAAGASRRLGEPKQLLNFRGQSLILHTLKQAFDAKCRSVFLVLGANSDLISPVVKHLPIDIIINKNWEKGMGSSVSVGINAVKEKFPNSKGVILMVGDQPFVSDDLIIELIKKQAESDFKIVASQYKNGFGVPAFFSENCFEELENLKGEKGAKKVILNHFHETGFVPFPKGEFDIDTKEDYAQLLKMGNYLAPHCNGYF